MVGSIAHARHDAVHRAGFDVGEGPVTGGYVREARHLEVAPLGARVRAPVIGRGEGDGEDPAGGVDVGRVLLGTRAAVAEVPGPRGRFVGGGVREADGERCGPGGLVRGEIHHRERHRRNRGDVVVLGFGIRTHAVGCGEYDRVGAGRRVEVRRVLHRARAAVPEGPGPGGDAVGRGVGEVHGERLEAGSRSGVEVGHRRGRPGGEGKGHADEVPAEVIQVGISRKRLSVGRAARAGAGHDRHHAARIHVVRNVGRIVSD